MWETSFKSRNSCRWSSTDSCTTLNPLKSWKPSAAECASLSHSYVVESSRFFVLKYLDRYFVLKSYSQSFHERAIMLYYYHIWQWLTMYVIYIYNIYVRICTLCWLQRMECAVGRDHWDPLKKRRTGAPWLRIPDGFFGKALEAETSSGHKRQGLAFWAPQEEL